MTKAYPGYLFDLDGTLVDTAPDINVALNRALAAVGLDGVDESLTRHWVGHGAQVLVQQALLHQQGPFDPQGTLDRLEPEDALTEVQRRFIEYYEARIAEESVPYPHVVETLHVLRERGAKLAVVTNKRTRLTVPLLEALDLDRLFHVVVCSDTTTRPKPAADPALYACSSLGLSPRESLFVGDSDTDVACARAAGCPIVCVRDGYNHGIPADQLGADAVIDSFRDLV